MNAAATSTPADGPALRAAAILDEGTCDIDALLAEVARREREAGRSVRGVVMHYPDGSREFCGAMVLIDLESRAEYLVSQALGTASRSCRVDPQGFAKASEVLRRALEAAPDLIITNRFGGLEAEGGGFSAELLEILSRDLPLLTAVAPRHLAAWQRFTGGGAALLPAREEAVRAWLQQTHAGGRAEAPAGA